MKRIVTLLIIMITLVGCTATPQEDGQILNIYSARHYDLDKEMIEAFKQKTGIQVNVIEGRGDELLERMIREKNMPQADLFITVGAETLSDALKEGLFSKVDLTSVKDVLDPQFYGERWVAITKRARIFVYDKESNPEKPNIESYFDITNPEFAKQVLVRSSTSSYNIALLASLIQTEGMEKATEWASGVVNNFARIPTGNDRDQARAVVAGLGQVAIMNTYYLILMANSSDPADQAVASRIGVIFPKKTHMNLSYASILQGAKNSENAKAFIEFLLEETQQNDFMRRNGEFPVRNDIELDPMIQSWGNFEVAPIDYETLGDVYAQAVILFDQVNWE